MHKFPETAHITDVVSVVSKKDATWCAQGMECRLSGQGISKGRIKAAAHAKDGDCFVCVIIPLSSA